MPDVFLSKIAYALGERHDLTELPEIMEPPGVANRLIAGGLSSFRLAKQAAWELAADSVRSTLDPAVPIDAVAYATDSFWCHDDQEIAAARFLEAAGLGRTPLIGTGYAGCANIALAIRTSAACLRSGDADSMLLVTTDLCEPGHRLLSGGIAVLSDGAASCIASTAAPVTGFRVLGQAMSVEAGLHSLSANASAEAMAMATATGRGVARTTAALYAKTGLAATDFAYLVTNNYTESSLRIFAGMTGIGFDRAHRSTVADVGHCYAADALINLASLDAAGMLEPDDRVLAVVTGHNTWACLALEVL